MYKLTFKLKQHTPIIHFQYFLSDATLRSTELKSALDKFIIGEKFNCWSSDKTERLNVVVAKTDSKFKKWLKHSKEPKNPSFDYDVELLVEEQSNKTSFDIDKLRILGFFGNQPTKVDYDDNAKYKKAILENRLIKLIIKSPYSELLGEIDNFIAKFFLLKNFGTRQSKGFGCFYPIEKYDSLLNQTSLPLYFDVNEQKLNSENNPYKSVFQIITMFYNTIRSGLNVKSPPHLEDKFYFKSLMWAYAKDADENWDKKSIKNEYKSASFTQEDHKWKGRSPDYKSNPSNFPLGYFDSKKSKTGRHLWRDLLGLSTDEKWGVKKIINDKSKISRFKSPIIFKPFLVGENKYRVFFGVDPALVNQFKTGAKANTEAEILGKEFVVKFNKSGNLKLIYPDTFDYNKYLRFAINTYNASTDWIKSDFHDTNEYQIIDSIYKQLKAQV